MNEVPKSLSRILLIEKIEPEAEHFALEADGADRTLLAGRYDIPEISLLKGEMDVMRSGDIVRVAGNIEAELGRTCVVSLEPMRERIEEDFVVEYTTDIPEDTETEVEIDLEAPEPLDSDVIDLGHVLLEQLVLAMNPHPRKEGATPPKDPGAGRESSPFDVLKGLKE